MKFLNSKSAATLLGLACLTTVSTLYADTQWVAFSVPVGMEGACLEVRDPETGAWSLQAVADLDGWPGTLRLRSDVDLDSVEWRVLLTQNDTSVLNTIEFGRVDPDPELFTPPPPPNFIPPPPPSGFPEFPDSPPPPSSPPPSPPGFGNPPEAPEEGETPEPPADGEHQPPSPAGVTMPPIYWYPVPDEEVWHDDSINYSGGYYGSSNYLVVSTTPNWNYTPIYVPDVDPWAEEHEDGWRRSSWLGWYQIAYTGKWFWHLEHGWYCAVTTPDSTGGLWLFSGTEGWVWTSPVFYPYLYRQRDADAGHSGWVYYLLESGIGGTRWYYGDEGWFSNERNSF